MQRKLRASLYPASAIDPAVRSALLPLRKGQIFRRWKNHSSHCRDYKREKPCCQDKISQILPGWRSPVSGSDRPRRRGGIYKIDTFCCIFRLGIPGKMNYNNSNTGRRRRRRFRQLRLPAPGGTGGPGEGGVWHEQIPAYHSGAGKDRQNSE